MNTTSSITTSTSFYAPQMLNKPLLTDLQTTDFNKKKTWDNPLIINLKYTYINPINCKCCPGMATTGAAYESIEVTSQ